MLSESILNIFLKIVKGKQDILKCGWVDTLRKKLVLNFFALTMFMKSRI